MHIGIPVVPFEVFLVFTYFVFRMCISWVIKRKNRVQDSEKHIEKLILAIFECLRTELAVIPFLKKGRPSTEGLREEELELGAGSESNSISESSSITESLMLRAVSSLVPMLDPEVMF